MNNLPCRISYKVIANLTTTAQVDILRCTVVPMI